MASRSAAVTHRAYLCFTAICRATYAHRDPRSGGNQVAASRWAGILRKLGHRVQVGFDYDGQPADMMVAVHAWRSAAAIARFKASHPRQPVILQLSGTDIYDYLESDRIPTLRSMELADRLVALNDLAWRVVPKALRPRLCVIHQSAAPLPWPRRPAGSGH